MNIDEESFVINYLIYGCQVELIEYNKFDEINKKPRKINVLSLKHMYDTKPLILTISQIFENNDSNQNPEFYEMYKNIQDFKNECNLKILKQIQQIIIQNSVIIPD